VGISQLTWKQGKANRTCLTAGQSTTRHPKPHHKLAPSLRHTYLPAPILQTNNMD
jgi:hypothetical protein